MVIIKVHDINNNLKELSLYKKVKKKYFKFYRKTNSRISNLVKILIRIYLYMILKSKKRKNKTFIVYKPKILSKINNNNNRNDSQNSQLLLPNIKQFKFKITKKKKIRHFNYNQNKII